MRKRRAWETQLWYGYLLRQQRKKGFLDRKVQKYSKHLLLFLKASQSQWNSIKNGWLCLISVNALGRFVMLQILWWMPMISIQLQRLITAKLSFSNASPKTQFSVLVYYIKAMNLFVGRSDSKKRYCNFFLKLLFWLFACYNYKFIHRDCLYIYKLFERIHVCCVCVLYCTHINKSYG